MHKKWLLRASKQMKMQLQPQGGVSISLFPDRGIPCWVRLEVGLFWVKHSAQCCWLFPAHVLCSCLMEPIKWGRERASIRCNGRWGQRVTGWAGTRYGTKGTSPVTVAVLAMQHPAVVTTTIMAVGWRAELTSSARNLSNDPTNSLLNQRLTSSLGPQPVY